MRKGLALAPDDDVLHMNLGRVYLGRDQPNKARFHCGQAIELNTHRDDARECMCLALLMMGRNVEAHKVLSPALRDRMPLSRYLLASSLAIRNEDPIGARRWLEAAAKVYGNRPEILEELNRIPAPSSPR